MARRTPFEKPWSQKYPGAFFGFLPDKATETATLSTPAAEEAAPPTRKKKRRRRRRKKSGPADAATPAADSDPERQS
jgi:hypothetical protein